MNKGKVVKFENDLVTLKMEDEHGHNCDTCSLSSLCKEKTVTLKHTGDAPLTEGQEVTVQFDWIGFTKAMGLVLFVPACIFVFITALLDDLFDPILYPIAIALGILGIYLWFIHKRLGKAQFFKLGQV